MSSNFFHFSIILGTIEERGIATWQNVDDPKAGKRYYAETYDIYNIPLPERIRKAKFLKYLPFMPKLEESENTRTLTDGFKDVLIGETSINCFTYAQLIFNWLGLHCYLSCMFTSRETDLTAY